MDNILAELLGSKHKAKLLRFFVANTEKAFTLPELKKALRLREDAIKKELKGLTKIELVKEKECKVDTKLKSGKISKRKSKCYFLNSDFKYLRALRQFVLQIDPTDDKELISIFKKVGSVKLLLLSGVFLQEESRVDLLIVADRLNEFKLKKAILEIESHIGQEISYVDFSSKEFEYRLSMYDKLVRDILDGNYKVLIDKLKNDWHELSMSK